MPVYRFHRFGWRQHLDHQGTELDGESDACLQAMKVLGETLKEGAEDTRLVVVDGDQIVCELIGTMRRMR